MQTGQESITLYDEMLVKHCSFELVKQSAGWRVLVEQGLLGETVKAVNKRTPNLMTYSRAKYVYDLLVENKIAEGYTPGARQQWDEAPTARPLWSIRGA